jgi:hypothetical protein
LVLGSWFLALGSVVCCLLSEKSSKSQMSTELSFVFDPLSWFLVPGSWFFVLPSIPVFLNQL